MKKITLLLLTLCLLTGCTPKTGEVVKLYYPSKDGDTVLEQSLSVNREGTLLETAILALLEGPHDKTMRRVIPENVRLLSATMSGTVAEINLSAPFDTGENAERLLARYTLIYTACSVPDVQKVKLYKDGQPLRSLRSGQDLEALGIADVVPTEPAISSPQVVTLYFPDAGWKKLYPEVRKVSLYAGQSVEEQVVRGILLGPSATQLSRPFREGTTLLSAETRAGICFVNLSADFLENHVADRGRDTLTVYSIVNSLCVLPHVQEVRFLIEGKTEQTFGHFSFMRGLTESKGLYAL